MFSKNSSQKLSLKFYLAKYNDNNDKKMVAQNVFTYENKFYNSKSFSTFSNYRPISKLKYEK